ncbi:MAG: CarD-like transcriptional regulator [uncultured Truepera sp.]|uniref:CarD-like transcriptional regulator n=1 Tax=uncultured Truepera sp. TaxID=543023 RepID=A0A6J4VL40_9DEIN|nr:MAG: CarD-like transcriptional regulator [uncultured Truepera sp.]
MHNVLERLNNGRVNLPKQWAARHRRVTEILSSGDPYQIATLGSELRRWDLERGLPDLDRQAYRRALRLLAGEISAVLGISSKEARAMMDAGDDDDLN